MSNPIDPGQRLDAQRGVSPGDGSSQVAEAFLVAQARDDPDAFGLLYERHVDRIYGYIYKRVRNVQDAEDLTARTFYQALEGLDRYEERGLPFSAWLYRIAHNLIANWHRDRGKRRLMPLDDMELASQEEDLPEQFVQDDERRSDLLQAIQRLPDERRDLLIYKFGERLSNLEIGQLMGKSESAIKSLYFRTLAVLRRDLNGHDP